MRTTGTKDSFRARGRPVLGKGTLAVEGAVVGGAVRLLGRACMQRKGTELGSTVLKLQHGGGGVLEVP